MSLEDKILDPVIEATNSMIANGQLPIEVATLVIQQLPVCLTAHQKIFLPLTVLLFTCQAPCLS
jgi:hypothetical protein